MNDQWTDEPELPYVSDENLRLVQQQSETKTIDIDGSPREIRTYGEKAVILLEWNDPRLISFERVQCNIVFEEGKFVIPMSVGDNYQEFHIGNVLHKVKLGVPTQEIVLDGKGYQCFFGGKPISIYLSGKNRTIRLDGRPPRVIISQVKNYEYLLGKIELIIDAKKIVPLYLDARPQRFSIDGKPLILKFIDNFKAVTVNGVRFNVEFGGLPISIPIRGYKRFLRFSNLPSYVIPGHTSVREMNRDDKILLPNYLASAQSDPLLNPISINSPLGVQPCPVLPQNIDCSAPPHLSAPLFPNLSVSDPRLFGSSLQAGPPVPPPSSAVVPGAYSSAPTENVAPISVSDSQLPVPSTTTSVDISSNTNLSSSQEAPKPSNFDLQGLLDRLVKTGILPSSSSKKEETKKDEAKNVLSDPVVEEDLDPFVGLAPMEHMFNLDDLRK